MFPFETAENHVLKHLLSMEKSIMIALTDLQAAVAANTTVIESAITLIGGFKAQLDAAIAQAQAGDMAALNELSAQLAAEDKKLADAVAANTPAAASAPAQTPAEASAPATTATPETAAPTATSGAQASSAPQTSGN